MRNNNRLVFLIAILCFTLFLFSIPAGAATDNFISAELTPVRDMDFSDSINTAPKLYIKAVHDVEAGSVFMLNLSETAEWTYDDVGIISPFFTKNNGDYVSTTALTDADNFGYTASVITGSDIQIITNEILPAGYYMCIPLIVKLDGVAEAAVTVSGGDAFGVRSGTYIFANRGGVNEFKLELSANSKTDGTVITGSITAELSAGAGSAGIDLYLPSGFAFDKSLKSGITLTGEGSYKQASLSDVFLSGSEAILHVKFEGVAKSTSAGKLTIGGIRVNALKNAADGDIKMLFSMPSYDINNEEIIFGEYKAEKTEEPEEQKPEPVPEKESTTVLATSGSNTIIINGEPSTLDAAPYNDETGRMLVPLRFIVNAFGVGDDGVKWDADKKEVTIVFSDNGINKEIVFTIGSTDYYINGVKNTMDTAAVINQDYTFIPVRYAADALGLTVSYTPETKTAEFILPY